MLVDYVDYRGTTDYTSLRLDNAIVNHIDAYRLSAFRRLSQRESRNERHTMLLGGGISKHAETKDHVLSANHNQ